jgi:hypothetical protein
MAEKLSRRRLLVGVPAAAAATMTPAAATALVAHPTGAAAQPGTDDTELIALELELDACYAEFTRIKARRDEDTDDAMDAANDRANAVIDAIMKKRPPTLAGLAVMARALKAELNWWHHDDLDLGFELEPGLKVAEALAVAVLEAARK